MTEQDTPRPIGDEALRAADVAWVKHLRDTPLYQCGHWLGDERICMLPDGHEKHTDEYAALATPSSAPHPGEPHDFAALRESGS